MLKAAGKGQRSEKSDYREKWIAKQAQMWGGEIDFPDAPAFGDEISSPNGRYTYRWDGQKWHTAQLVVPSYRP